MFREENAGVPTSSAQRLMHRVLSWRCLACLKPVPGLRDMRSRQERWKIARGARKGGHEHLVMNALKLHQMTDDEY